MKAEGYGARFASSRLPMLIGAGSIFVLVLGFGGWATFTEIDGAVVAPGKVIVDRNRQAIQHPDGGVVEEVVVTEGERVEAGAVLVRFDGTLARAELAGIEGQLAEVIARRGRLDAERDDLDRVTFDPALVAQAQGDPAVARYIAGQTRLFEMRREGLLQEVTQLENQQLQLQNQIEGIDAQLAALDRQAVLIAEEMKIQKELLDKGLAQSTKVRTLEREEARLAGMVGEMIATRAQANERVCRAEHSDPAAENPAPPRGADHAARH